MVKTVNQLLCGVHLAATAEALSLAAKAGIDLALALRIFGQSSAASWMLNDCGPRMLEAEPAVTSAVDIFVKDFGLCFAPGRTRAPRCRSRPPPTKCFWPYQAQGTAAPTTARSSAPTGR
jgi:3-hydroxyisobutyrate dehydrogenase-like beta-hydroxyacid dehydrogenase